MMKDPLKSASRFLSLVLRHNPGAIDLFLDENGWADVDELLEKMAAANHTLTIENLESIVNNNDKQRFSFSPDRLKIRANQGHSIDVDLQLQEQIPPPVLFHGTATKNLSSILKDGILKGSRHHVHLSADKETAIKVGMRHGRPVVIEVDAKKMSDDGISFFRSENQVWLTDHVAPVYLFLNR